MRFKSGLRSEIVINTILLTTAALLFSGFLLTKLLERELIAQRVRNATGLMETLAGSIAQGGQFSTVDGSGGLNETVRLLQRISAYSSLEAWAVVDKAGELLADFSGSDHFQIDKAASVEVRYSHHPAVRVVYDGIGESISEGYILITVPVMKRGSFNGALQARFALSEVRERVNSARKFILAYAVLYGFLLVLFGVYTLGRSVLRPVRRLREMSQRIAAGDLEQAVPLEGPVEIADLAGSFNSMAIALREGQREREAHIGALERANAEIRKAQDDLVRSEKMASVGHLTAGMAHEIGNPLGAVVGYLGLLKAETAPGREADIVERALAEVGRIDRLVRDLLDYAAPSDDKPEFFDPVGAITEARNILAQQGVFGGIEIDDHLPPSLPSTQMVRHKLVQVFINLLLNARDALAAGGAIRLGAGVEMGLLWLAVADTGRGMEAEVLEHIFEPFYSTKEPGKGRGLGLAICHRVVEEAGGRIEVASVPGKSSEFKVWLPIAESNLGGT